jgi:hypothetical protein
MRAARDPRHKRYTYTVSRLSQRAGRQFVFSPHLMHQERKVAAHPRYANSLTGRDVRTCWRQIKDRYCVSGSPSSHAPNAAMLALFGVLTIMARLFLA